MNRKPIAILLADPDPLSSETLSEMVKACGHAVTPVKEMISGLRIIELVLFDVLLVPVDQHHSMMDLTFIEAVIRKQPDIKIIGISGDINQPTATSSAAIDIFLRKPFTLDQLAQVIHDVTGRQAAA